MKLLPDEPYARAKRKALYWMLWGAGIAVVVVLNWWVGFTLLGVTIVTLVGKMVYANLWVALLPDDQHAAYMREQDRLSKIRRGW